jgi:hypothetical protein
MAFRITSTRGKLLATGALLTAAAGAAGLGTFGSFTSTTSASETVGSGSVTIALGANGPANRMSVAASNIVPGDTIQRAVTLTNSGTSALSGIYLTTNATTSSQLDTDPTNGLQLSIASCSTSWTEAGTAPGYSYTCSGSGTTQTVLASTKVIGSNMVLNNLTSLAPTKTDNLVVTLSFPSSAGNGLETQNSVINFSFTANQRAAANS